MRELMESEFCIDCFVDRLTNINAPERKKKNPYKSHILCMCALPDIRF